MVLFVLCEVGLCVPLGWSGLPNRKAFRKLINVNRGERIHNSSSENDELPDGVIALLPLCKIKFEHCLFMGKASNTTAVIYRSGVVIKNICRRTRKVFDSNSPIMKEPEHKKVFRKFVAMKIPLTTIFFYK